MRHLIFFILSKISYLLRPFRHGLYMKVLQKAYELQGIKFYECPHVTKLAKFKLPSCSTSMFWNTLCRI